MNHDIVIVRDGDAYRLLHGHLRLATLLQDVQEVCVDINGEGKVKVMRTRDGYLVDKDAYRLPLRGN